MGGRLGVGFDHWVGGVVVGFDKLCGRQVGCGP